LAKLTLTDLVNLANESSVVDTINDNNAAIAAALENTLSRDGTLPNSLTSDFDVNSFRIYNLVPPINDTEPVRKKEYDELIDTVEDVYDATNVLYQDFKDKFLGAFASDPALDNDGDPLQLGALYYSSSSDRMKVYQSSGWSPISSVWHYGVGAPSGGTGENNDYYLSTIGDVYQKSDGVWSGVLFSLKGTDGADGGSVTVIGTLANVGLLPGSGTVGDGYIISGELHVWTGAAWTNVGTITGPTGAQGPIGNTGPTGAAGSTISHGTGVPSNGLGANGDYYLDTDTSDLYYKDSGAYSVVVNIKGDTGATGAAGATGATGATGDTGATGAAGANGADGTDGKTWFSGNGVPAGGTGVVGDFYLDLDTSDIYEKTDVATWTSIGSFKGDTGSAGAAGSTGATGDAGRPAGVKYTYDSTVAKVDPGAGKVRFNSASAASVTELYIDDEDADTNNVTSWLDALDDSTTTANRGTLFFRANNTGTIGIYQVNGSVVDETGYRTVPVSYVAGTLPANNDSVYFVFSRTGNVGATGSGSGDMSKSVYDPNDDGKVTNAVNADNVPWSGVSSKPTTLSGFGITDGQPLDTELTALAGLTSAADKLPYFTGAGTAALAGLTTVGRNLIDDATVADQRTTLGLGSLATKSSIATTDIDADAVTYAKIQNVSATDRILGRSTAGAGDVEEITCTAAGRNLLDDADASAQRTTLGLGTASSPQFTGVELGHATDTTLTRSAAGVLAVESNLVPSPASQAHGDVLFRGASNWERLAAGTSGRFLKTQGAGAAPVWDTVSAGGMTLLGTINTASGGASQNISGLTLTNYKFLLLIYDAVSSSADTSMLLGNSTADDNTIVASLLLSNGALLHGFTLVELGNGVAVSVTYGGSAGAGVVYVQTAHPLTTASTAVSLAVASGAFDAGAVRVYGVA
jgi:hypothetical protein